MFDLTWYSCRIALGGLGLVGQEKVAAHIAELLTPLVARKTRWGSIKFCCPSTTSYRRATSLLTKEPQTIAWIDTFDCGDVLWDVGANIGAFALYAAKKGHRVVAFEPAASNYYGLCRNIEINKLSVTALCLAISNMSGFGKLYMKNTSMGGAENSFGTAIDWNGQPYIPKWEQTAIGATVDALTESLEFPNHIKIDVDGLENRVLAGAERTLCDSRLKSILVEASDFRLLAPMLGEFSIISVEKKTGVSNFVCRKG